MKSPEIRIYFSWLLYDKVSIHLDKLFATGDNKIVSREQAETFTENYRLEWAKHQASIIPAMIDCVGSEFYRDVIDVPCAPWMWSISDPLIMGFKFYPDQFVDQLTHELCHVLLTDNKVYSMRSSRKEQDVEQRWKRLYGSNHDFTCLVHIPVHAISKYIYLDILKEPYRLQRDIDLVSENEPYRTAWEYVNTHDYKEIIAQLKQDYVNLKQELAK